MRSLKGDSTLSTSNLISIKDLKQKYLDLIGAKDVKIVEIRFFCMGKELKDDMFLYNYDIKDEMTV